MAPDERQEQFNMRMSELERRMLNELAEMEGLTSSEYVRSFIRREHKAHFGAVPKKKKR